MRKRIIITALACAMLVMGAGYAYWTDAITMTATVDSGEFDVDFISSSAKEIGNNFNATNYKETWERIFGIPVAGTAEGYKNEEHYDDVSDTIECNEDQLSIALHNLYPGHAESYYVKAKNAGNVAAKLGQINTSFTGYSNTYIRDMIGISLKAEQDGAVSHWTLLTGWIDGDSDILGPEELINLGLNANDFFYINGKPYIRVSSLNALTDVDETNSNLYNILFLDDDCEIEFTIEVAMDPDSIGRYTTGKSESRVTTVDDSWTEEKNVALKLDFVWDQYNQK